MKIKMLLCCSLLLFMVDKLPVVQFPHADTVFAQPTGGGDPIEPQPDPIPPDLSPGGSNDGSKVP